VVSKREAKCRGKICAATKTQVFSSTGTYPADWGSAGRSALNCLSAAFGMTGWHREVCICCCVNAEACALPHNCSNNIHGETHMLLAASLSPSSAGCQPATESLHCAGWLWTPYPACPIQLLVTSTLGPYYTRLPPSRTETPPSQEPECLCATSSAFGTKADQSFSQLYYKSTSLPQPAWTQCTEGAPWTSAGDSRKEVATPRPDRRLRHVDGVCAQSGTMRKGMQGSTRATPVGRRGERSVCA
jgi:hypothetical protein